MAKLFGFSEKAATRIVAAVRGFEASGRTPPPPTPPSGATSSTQPPDPPLARVTVHTSGSMFGVYTGYRRRPVKQKFDPTRTGLLNAGSINDFGELPSDLDEIYIMNGAEEGTSTHALTAAGGDASRTHIGYLMCIATDGKPVYFINGSTGAEGCDGT